MIWLLGLVLLVLGGPVLGGVVEDAEESLKSIPTDNPSGKRFTTASGVAPVGEAPRATRPSATYESDPGAGANGRRYGVQRSGPGSSRATSRASSPEGTPTPSAEVASGRKEREKRDRADAATSFVGALVLLALMAGAGLYSKHIGRDD